MKIKNLIAVAAFLLGGTSAFAQSVYSGNFKIQPSPVVPGKYEITDFSNDFAIPTDGIVAIPATLPNTSGDPYQVVGIADGAFASFGAPSFELRLDIKGVTIAKEIKYIGANAFANFGNLATVTFAEGSKLTTIGNGAFAQDPMLRSISFANCAELKYFTINGLPVMDGDDYNATLPNAIDPATASLTAIQAGALNDGGYNVYNGAAYAAGDAVDPNDADDYNLSLPGSLPIFANTYATPFYNGADNTRLTSITLNTNTMDFGLALANVVNLETVNIKETKIRVLNGFALNGNVKITTLELPAKKFYDPETGEELGSYAVTLEDDALTGTVIKTLTINGNVGFGDIGQVGVPQTSAAVPTLTTVTITGKVAAGGIVTGAFLGNTKLATVTIQGAVEDGAVDAGAFEGAGSAATANATTGIKLTVTASQAGASAFNAWAFVDPALSAAAAAALAKDVSLALASTAGTPTIYRAKIVEAPAAPGKIFVETNDNQTYYAKYHATAKTAVKRGDDADVVVYSAYADGTNIYMDPLYTDNGKFIFGSASQAEAQNVIIKVKGTSKLLKTDEETGKKYIECEGTTYVGVSMRYGYSATKPYNEIRYNGHITNQDLNALAGAGKMMYAVKKISTNGLKWAPISNEGTFYVNDAFFIEVAKPAAGGRVNVIWLDEEGNTTAIQKVEVKSADSDAIYNLRGEKVNAAYKGLVIKNGKKYIQK